MAEAPHDPMIVIDLFASADREHRESGILYRPQFVKEVGGVTSSILLQQIFYWWHKSDKKPFYKFKQPCGHSLYREGDSWCEELSFSRNEFDTALRNIGIKKMADMNIEQVMQQALEERKPVVYWTDAGRVTHYDLHPVVMASILEGAYLKRESSVSKSGKAALGKEEKQLYEKRESSDTNTDTTTYQPDTSSEIPPNSAEKPPEPEILPQTENPNSITNRPVDSGDGNQGSSASTGDYGGDVLRAAQNGTQAWTVADGDGYSGAPLDAYCELVGLSLATGDPRRETWARELQRVAGLWEGVGPRHVAWALRAWKLANVAYLQKCTIGVGPADSLGWRKPPCDVLFHHRRDNDQGFSVIIAPLLQYAVREDCPQLEIKTKARASPGRKRGHRETTWPGEEEEAAQFVARLEQQQAAAEEEPLDVEAMLGPEA